MPSSSARPKRINSSTAPSSRDSSHENRREVYINIYDLLPPGRLSTILWTIGGSLLHSGVVLRDREYAYGGHDRRDLTGVYWTRPRIEPPGGTFRTSLVHGVTSHSEAEIDRIVKDVSDEFPGTRYNLLTNNCNHFTSVLCERLTGKPAPAWVNRAASIGLALPCVVPKEWVSPPDVETADGELVGEEEDATESSGMIVSDRRRREREENTEGGLDGAQGKRPVTRSSTPPPRLVTVKDTNGRDMPPAERAPLPRKRSSL